MAPLAVGGKKDSNLHGVATASSGRCASAPRRTQPFYERDMSEVCLTCVKALGFELRHDEADEFDDTHPPA